MVPNDDSRVSERTCGPIQPEVHSRVRPHIVERDLLEGKCVSGRRDGAYGFRDYHNVCASHAPDTLSSLLVAVGHGRNALEIESAPGTALPTLRYRHR